MVLQASKRPFADRSDRVPAASGGRSAGEFISEVILPVGPSFDAGAMSRGEPGLPQAFEWRGRKLMITSRIEQWKATSAEGGRAAGQVYLRRHYYRLGMSDGSVWTVYFTRQTPPSGSPKSRWFLYTIGQPTDRHRRTGPSGCVGRAKPTGRAQPGEA
jgi:hypothetical protein